MKQGWEIKKLGEVCQVSAGQGAPQGEDKYGTIGKPFIKAGNLEGLLSGVDESEIQHVNEDVAKQHRLKLYPRGSVLFAKSGMSCMKGHVYALKTDCYVVSHLAVLTPTGISTQFLTYLLNYYRPNTLVKDSAYPSISLEDIKVFTVPVPPIAEQEKIVAELDCLSGIIEKKKQQLKELDNLAQSIFYEMFGDPVENDKGWEMKRLGDVSDVTSFKRVLIEDVVKEGVPFIRGTELSALSKLPNSKNYEFTLFITPEHYNKVKAISGVPVIGDLLIPSINADGLIWVVDTNEPRYYKDGRVLWVHTNREYSNSTALRYIMSNKLRLLYKELASGATFIELKLFVLRDMVLPFPPLTLQQDFASKIESIEKQKELIVQSIKETETLFNSRMDYYFN